MPKTAVGLFKNPASVDAVLKEIECLGIPKQEVQTLEEPYTFPVNGAMSFTRADYEAELKHALGEIGATESEGKAYIDGLRNGGALVLASGPDQKVEEAATIMNRLGAIDVEKTSGAEPELPETDVEDAVPTREAGVQAGRIREASSGAQLFVW